MCGHLTPYFLFLNHISKKHFKGEEDRFDASSVRITCPVCEKEFASRHAIMSHMKMHSGFGGVKPHYCDICNKTFAGRAYFR